MKIQRKIFLIIAIMLTAIFLFYWYFGERNTNNLQKVVFYQNSQKITEIFVEVADSAFLREKGLMYRKTLPENQGMLFIFPEKDHHSFWMKNTLIPLDLIFLDENKTIVSIIRNVLPCKENPCPVYQPKEKSQYVIEVNSGFCDKYNLQEGTRAEF